MDNSSLSKLQNIATPQQQKSFPLFSKIIDGGLGGIIGVACVFPIDLAKTRLQNQKVGNETYKSLSDCLKKVIYKDGFSGMYRGSLINLILITPEKAIKLTCNDLFRHLLTTEAKSNNKQGHISLTREVIAGGGAGLCQVVVTTPMELLKIQGQYAGHGAQNEVIKPSLKQFVRQLINTEGFAGLYKGFYATMLRDVSFSVIYFPLFAHLSSKGLQKFNHHFAINKESVFMVNFSSGIAAGTVAALAVNPIDVVKTRLQVIASGANEARYTGVTNAFINIYKEEGSKAFMKGAISRVMYIGPLFGIAQAVYYLGVGEKLLTFKYL